MNEIEKLNERIAQLTDLVKSGEETISATKEMLKLAEQERDRLADQRRESEPKFERVAKYEKYYSLVFNSDAQTTQCIERGEHCYDDTDCYESNNYFHTEERAKEVADKINLLLKLERLHDTFCPEYVPDWNNHDENKYSVFYDYHYRRYCASSYNGIEYKINVFFATREIAQKVCDILNAELEEKR